MFAILGGLAAAAFWTVTTLCSSRSSRLIGSVSVLAWVMISGLIVTAPMAAINGIPANLHGSILAWLVLSGVCNVGGLLFAYEALRLGKVGLASPVISTEGAIAAVIAVVAGESLGLPRGVALAAIAIGIVAVAAGSAGEEAPGHHDVQAVLMAGAAALSFGLGLYSTGRVSSDVPLVWAVLPARVVGVIAVAIPLVLAGRLRLTRRALPLVVISGLCEVGGYFAYAFGARHGIAVTAVLGSQFAVLAAIVAYFLFGEKLGRRRIAGVVVTALGVAVLSALQA
jgi:drug/metabolite transporter (DMT)-like permease